MRITDTAWTPQVNMLEIQCDRCESFVVHRSDRWRVACPECGREERLDAIRDRYVEENRREP